MLDVHLVRADPESMAKHLARRGFAFDAAAFADFERRRKQMSVATQKMRAKRNALSKKIGELLRSGLTLEQAKAEVDAMFSNLNVELDELIHELNVLEEEQDTLLLEVPNLVAPEVPDGADASDNRVLSRWGTPPMFPFKPKDHAALGSALGGLDFEAGGKVAGARFTVMRGEVAELHRALIQFMLDLHTRKHGYTEVNVPYIVNRDALVGTGQLPKFEEDLFRLDGGSPKAGFYLIPTAEVPVTNLAQDRIIEDEDLGTGLRFVCHSPCFRSEAGSYGKDARGMIRQHQFEKVELVQITRPADARNALEELTGHAEAVLRALELPYRKVLLCAGDTGFSASKTYDLEVWLPGQGAYREISSCSHFGEYQARRMLARWRNPETGKPELLHTLNGSALAAGRCLVAVLENGQRKDGGIRIPKVLRPYLANRKLIPPPG